MKINYRSYVVCTVLALVSAFLPSAVNAQTSATSVACPVGYTCTAATPTSLVNPLSVQQCFLFTWYLNYGDGTPSKNPQFAADVRELQTFLMNRGYSVDASEQSPTSYFGQTTWAAVKAFQVANGIPDTGIVGPITIAKLNASCNNRVSLLVDTSSSNAVSGAYQVNLSFNGGSAVQAVSSWNLYIQCPSNMDVNTSPGASCNSSFQMGTNGQNYGNVLSKAFWFKNYSGTAQIATLTLTGYSDDNVVVGSHSTSVQIPPTSSGQQTWSQVTVLSPNGGRDQSFSVGQPMTVTWKTVAGDFQFLPTSRVQIYLLQRSPGQSGIVKAIFDNLPNSGSATVTIPNDVPAGNNYKVAVTVYAYAPDYPGTAQEDESDSTFTVTAQTVTPVPVTPVITSISAPIYVGENVMLNGGGFTSTSKLVIDGRYYNSVNSNLNISSSRISFNIPAVLGSACFAYDGQCTGLVPPGGYPSSVGSHTVSVVNSAGGTASNQVSFDVRSRTPVPVPTPASVSVNSPGVGSRYSIGSQVPIAWSTSGSNVPSTVMIGYTPVGGRDVYITDVSTSAGRYTWTIPSNFTGEVGPYQIWVALGDGGIALGRSPSFSIVDSTPAPSPTASFSYGGYTSTNPPSSVTQGSYAELRWSSTGASSCEAVSAPSLAAWTGNKATSGSESFNMPTTVSGPVSIGVRCRNAAGAEVASSVVNFEVKPVSTPTVTLSFNSQAVSSSPFGAGVPTITAGTDMNVTWSSVGADSCTAREVIENGTRSTGSFDSQWSGSKDSSPGNHSQPIHVPADMTPGIKTIGIQCLNSAGWKVVNGYLKVVAPTAQTSSAIDSFYSALRSIFSW